MSVSEKPLQNQSITVSSRPAPSKLWYKNYMVWIFVIGLPLFVVLACIWFVFYSVQIQDSTVRDDWYMDGKTLYADVSKDKLAHDLGLAGSMSIDNNKVNFNLTVPAQDNFTLPNELMVEISHATQKSKDRDFIIKRTANGQYAGTVNLDASKGKYYIVLHDLANQWRLRTVTELPNTTSISFKPLTAFDAQK